MTENFKGRDLRGSVFRGQDLTDADFSGADIRGVDFTNATLTNANFYQARSGVLTSWAMLIAALMAASVVVMNFLAAMIAGVCVGPVVNMGSFSIFSGGVTCLLLVAIFMFSVIRQGLRTAALVSLSANVLIFLTLFLIAVAGGALGFVPITGVVSVGRGLTGGVAGLFIGNSLIAAIVILSMARAIAGNVSAWGGRVVAVLGLGALGMGASYAIIMSMAMSVIGRGGLEKLLPAPSFAKSLEAQVNLPPEQAWQLILAAGGPQTEAIAVTGTIAMMLLVGLPSLYLGRQILRDRENYGGIRQFAIAIATARGTCFQGAALERANFTEATLGSTNFLKARLTHTLW
jgi:Pentapeptide repeats (8 copies)